MQRETKCELRPAVLVLYSRTLPDLKAAIHALVCRHTVKGAGVSIKIYIRIFHPALWKLIFFLKQRCVVCYTYSFKVCFHNAISRSDCVPGVATTRLAHVSGASRVSCQYEMIFK